MKKKIRIKKKFLDETTQPPMGRTSVRTPTQKIGSKTKKLTYDVPQDVRNQLQQMLDASKQDPTQKLPITDRVINWFKGLFAPKAKTFSDEEVDMMSTSKEKRSVKPDFSRTQPNIPDPARLSKDTQKTLNFSQDTMVKDSDVEGILTTKKGKEELSGAFDDILKEIFQRHFK